MYNRVYFTMPYGNLLCSCSFMSGWCEMARVRSPWGG